MKNLFITFCCFALSSCAFHTGNVSTGGAIDCPMIVRVEGHSKTVHVFGIGGLDKEALISEAKNDLYANCRLRKGVHISNFILDFKTSYFPFVIIQNATVTADVYDCNSSFPADTTARSYAQFFTKRKNGLKVGDSILLAPSMTKGVIKNLHVEGGLAMQAKNVGKKNLAYNVSYFDANNVLMPLSEALYYTGLPYSNTFKITSEPENAFLFGYEVGETFLILDPVTKKKEFYKIIGLHKTKLLVEKMDEKGIAIQQVVDKKNFRTR